MPATPEQCRRYRQSLKTRAILAFLFHDQCFACGARGVPLQFAHLKPTTLKGEGRGLDRRYRDILRHPDCYARLCANCHRHWSPEDKHVGGAQ